MTDVAVGLSILGLLAAVLASAVGRERTAELRLADDRAAARVAEHAMLNLQHRQPLAQVPTDVRVSVRKLDDSKDVSPGFVWAQVDATVRGRHSSLVGLAPVDAINLAPGDAGGAR
jgi:hypothetical protein